MKEEDNVSGKRIGDFPPENDFHVRPHGEVHRPEKTAGCNESPESAGLAVTANGVTAGERGGNQHQRQRGEIAYRGEAA
jgi:hypothetical protein